MSEKSENMTIEGLKGAKCPPPAGICLSERQRIIGAVDIVIRKDGTWTHEGAPMTRPALVKLFASVLRRDRDGAYWLVTPAEVARIDVEEAPFLAVEMQNETDDRGHPVLTFRTNIDTWVTADATHPIRVETSARGEPRPFLQVCEDGTEARLLPAVFYALAEAAEAVTIDGKTHLHVESAGVRFDLGAVDED